MQIDHYAVCTTIIVPQWGDRQLRQHKSWSAKKELTVEPETCWNDVWLPAEEQQEQEPKWDPVHERKHQLKK